MSEAPRINEFGQPIGLAVAGWRRPARPSRQPIQGRWCRLEPLDPGRHAAALFAANALDADGGAWTYLPYGPFADLVAYRAWMEAIAAGDDPLFFAIVDAGSGQPVGVASYLRVDPAAFEGVFRQALVMKERNRDTAWFAATDQDWPALAAVFDRWLAPENFDGEGRQRLPLSALTAPLLARAATPPGP